MQRRTSFLTVVAVGLFALVPNALGAARLADQRVAPEHESPAKQSRPHGLIAPRAVCPDQGSADASIAVQRRAMRCMTEYARQSRGLPGLGEARKLDRSATGKAADILRCDSFSHFACGRDFTYWMARSGYLSARCWRVGENLAWGIGESTVRAIFRGWMHSPEHRHNILAKGFREIGISVRIGDLAGRNHSSVWTQHFGSHC
jgi:uncharacterized protein YkwD